MLAFAAEIKVEERIEAQNRLAKCLWELGDLAGSKKEYQATLLLDPLNRIAERNLERLKGLMKQVGKKITPSSELAPTPAGIFIQEAGTTGFAHLTNVTDVATLAQVNPGDAVELLTLGNRLIAKANGIEIGRVEPRIAARLLKLIADATSTAPASPPSAVETSASSSAKSASARRMSGRSPSQRPPVPATSARTRRLLLPRRRRLR